MVVEVQFNDIFGENLIIPSNLIRSHILLCRKYLLSRIIPQEQSKWRRNLFSGHGPTNTMLREIKYFQTLIKSIGNFTQIAWSDIVIIGFGRAILILPIVIQLLIEDAFLYPDSTHTLLSYKISVTMLFMWKLILTTMMNINSS